MLVLLAACAAPGEPETLLTGWSYEWEQLSHRISYLEVAVAEDTSLSLGLVGGDWSTGGSFTDTPAYRVRYQRVSAAGLTVLRGSVTFEVGPEATGNATLAIEGADLPEDADLVAVLNGFAIDTGVPQGADYPDYDPAHGYTSNGFGFALGEVERDGDALRVPVEATVRWGPQDRDDMNAAIPFAITEVTVHVAVLAGAGALETATVRASADLPYEPSYSDHPPMTAGVAFADGAPEGIVAWRSFDLQLNLEGVDAGQGDYLRAFGVELEPTAVERGSYTGDVTATLSTSSFLELSDPYVGFVGELVRLPADDVLAEHWVVEGSHPTGTARTGRTAE